MGEFAELLTGAGNFAVVQLPGRQFPGVVFQGDSLNILVEELSELRSRAGSRVNEEWKRDFTEILDRLSKVRESYERTLTAQGKSLPYPKR